MTSKNPFKYFKTGPAIIKLAVMYYIRFPLSSRQVEGILHERGVDVCHETIRFWWNRFGPIFAKAIRRRRPNTHSLWRWRIDEVFVNMNGDRFYLWRAIDHEGTVLECVVTKKRDRRAALKSLRRLLSKYGSPHEIVTDKLGSYRAALCDIGYPGTHETGQYENNQCENSLLEFRSTCHRSLRSTMVDLVHFRRREPAMGRFRSVGSLQKFTSIQSQIHSLFQH